MLAEAEFYQLETLILDLHDFASSQHYIVAKQTDQNTLLLSGRAAYIKAVTPDSLDYPGYMARDVEIVVDFDSFERSVLEGGFVFRKVTPLHDQVLFLYKKVQ